MHTQILCVSVCLCVCVSVRCVCAVSGHSAWSIRSHCPATRFASSPTCATFTQHYGTLCVCVCVVGSCSVSIVKSFPLTARISVILCADLCRSVPCLCTNLRCQRRGLDARKFSNRSMAGARPSLTLVGTDWLSHRPTCRSQTKCGLSLRCFGFQKEPLASEGQDSA